MEINFNVIWGPRQSLLSPHSNKLKFTKIAQLIKQQSKHHFSEGAGNPPRDLTSIRIKVNPSSVFLHIARVRRRISFHGFETASENPEMSRSQKCAASTTTEPWTLHFRRSQAALRKHRGHETRIKSLFTYFSWLYHVLLFSSCIFLFLEQFCIVDCSKWSALTQNNLHGKQNLVTLFWTWSTLSNWCQFDFLKHGY